VAERGALGRRVLLAAPLALLCRPAASQNAETLAPLLARLIEASRTQAIAAGVQKMPESVRRGLAGYFPDALLRKVRFAAGAVEGNAAPALAFAYGDAAAMTLGDTIVFRDRWRAESDLKLWAHELTHVQQYDRWGIDGFAERYVRDSKAVEQEAYGNADRFEAWRARRR